MALNKIEQTFFPFPINFTWIIPRNTYWKTWRYFIYFVYFSDYQQIHA